jgi:CheY-like chemotaxis protein
VEAIQDKGVLNVITSNVMLDARELAPFPGTVPGPYVQIQITDTGVGIVKENLDRVFEPFFTTKPEGQGTGLGLSMVYGTIKNHGGTVSLESEIDQGTTVTIHLPAVEMEPEPTPKKKTNTSLTLGTGTVLLVEDEKLIRNSVKKMLEKLGFDVAVATNGRDAVASCEERKGNLTLVILDIIMPVMDGTETFYAIRQAYPNLKVLLSSGYAREDRADNLLNAGAIGFIQKPYTFETLARELAKIL